MAGPGFMDLPPEVQIKIIQLAIPPMILPEYRTTSGRMVSTNEHETIRAIMATCHEFRNILLKTRALTGRSSTTGQRLTFDVERDALLVRGANIPALVEDDDVPNLHAVRRLISLRQCSIGWDLFPLMQRTLLLRRMPRAINATDEDRIYTSFEEGLPFRTSFPVAQKLCSLREMDLAIKHAPGWHISSLQQFCPQPEHRRIEPVLEALKHPVHHTGLRWTNPRLEGYHSMKIPMIGLHGYSKTRRDRRNRRSQEYSQGSQWAGFRVYLETEEVEFRPLTWDEVEPIVHRQKQPETGRKLPDHQDPEFVSRV